MNPHWLHFEHDADIGVLGCGPSAESAFEQAALALTGIVTDPSRVARNRQVRVQCTAPDLELLLVDWLNRVIYEMATGHCLFAHYQVRIDRQRLEAVMWGETIDRLRHTPAVEPKGATYTMLKVRQRADGWCASCVVDV